MSHLIAIVTKKGLDTNTNTATVKQQILLKISVCIHHSAARVKTSIMF